MDYREFVKRALTVVILITLTILLILGVGQIIPLLVLVFTAWVIAVTLEVPVRLLQRLRLKRVHAVLISILALLVLGGLFIALVLPPFIQQSADLIEQVPGAAQRTIEDYVTFRESSRLAARILPPLNDEGLEGLLLGDAVIFTDVEPGQQEPVINIAELAYQALPVLGRIGNFVVSALANLLLIMLLALLFLLEPVDYYRAIVSVVPHESEARTLEIINVIRQNIVTWLGAMLTSMGVTTLLFLVVLGVILGLPDALALSLFAGLATFVPTFGPVVALIPVAVVAAVDGLPKLLITIVLYASVGAVQDRVITPAIMKSEMNIPAAGLVVFQLILGAAIGPLGLLLAVPILAILVTLVRELYVFDLLHKEDALPDVAAGQDGSLQLTPRTPQAKRHAGLRPAASAAGEGEGESDAPEEDLPPAD